MASRAPGRVARFPKLGRFLSRFFLFIMLSDQLVLSKCRRNKIGQKKHQNWQPEAVNNVDLPAHVWRCIGVVVHCVRPLQSIIHSKR